jgi:DNA-binding winged helix-turn-helix (wHTH) protein
MTPIDPPGAKELYAFGPFRVDPDKQLLLRGDDPVPLTPKAFQILLVLIRHGQEVVTKDDLMMAVWPDTFVEEGNVSRTIFMLRKALGDSAQDRFIITIPGRGYRFGEHIRVMRLEADRRIDIAVATHTAAQVDVEVRRRSGRMTASAVVAAVVVAAVGIAAIRWVWQPRRLLTEKDTLVLADFANTTGDPVFDVTLRQGLMVQFEQSPVLSVVSDQRIHQVLQLMRQPANTPLMGETAHEVCERAGAAGVVEGSIANLGTRYVLGLKARQCRTGDSLADEQAQAARKEEVLTVLSDMVRRFRERLGESLDAPRRGDHLFARSAACIQRWIAGARGPRRVRVVAAFPARRRDRPGICVGARMGRARLRRSRSV